MKEKVINFFKDIYEEFEDRYDFSIFQEVIISHFTVCCLGHFFKPCSLDVYIVIFLLACVMGLDLARIFSIWKNICEIEYIVDDVENPEEEKRKMKIVDCIWGGILTLLKGMVVILVAWLEFILLF